MTETVFQLGLFLRRGGGWQEEDVPFVKTVEVKVHPEGLSKGRETKPSRSAF